MRLPLHVLSDAALTLDPADRIALASLLIDSVEDAADPDWERSRQPMSQPPVVLPEAEAEVLEAMH
jgi:hypothetical protein